MLKKGKGASTSDIQTYAHICPWERNSYAFNTRESCFMRRRYFETFRRMQKAERLRISSNQILTKTCLVELNFHTLKFTCYFTSSSKIKKYKHFIIGIWTNGDICQLEIISDALTTWQSCLISNGFFLSLGRV